MIWIKNTSGKPDAMLTFAFLSFAVVTINVLLATFSSISFNGVDITFVQMDAASMTAYLAATFTAYVTRRWTDAKHTGQDSSENLGG
jgi:cytidylate kinase